VDVVLTHEQLKLKMNYLFAQLPSHYRCWVSFFISIFACSACWGQVTSVNSSVASSQSPPLATVNGKPIDLKTFDQIIKNNVANGIQDNEQLRSAVRDELIARQVMVQEFSKLGLDKNPEAISGLSFVRENFLIDFLLRHHEQKHPLTEEKIKAEYDRQLTLIGEPGEAMQYLTRLIVLSTESEARGVIAELKKGGDFAKMASAQSIDATKKNGGELGWVLPAQVLPAIGTVMVNLKEGAFSALPIQTPSGWYVIKVEEKRPFKIPTLEESRNVVIQTLQQTQRQAYVQELIKAAKITK
jgi:peptidyl-prolyl cis-trans isomerase C